MLRDRRRRYVLKVYAHIYRDRTAKTLYSATVSHLVSEARARHTLEFFIARENSKRGRWIIIKPRGFPDAASYPLQFEYRKSYDAAYAEALMRARCED